MEQLPAGLCCIVWDTLPAAQSVFMLSLQLHSVSELGLSLSNNKKRILGLYFQVLQFVSIHIHC